MKLICKLLSVLLCGFLLAGCAPKSESRTFFAMDTVMNLTVCGEEGLLDDLQARVQTLEKHLSVTDPQSEIYALNQNGSTRLSDDTRELLELALGFCRATDGALDITIYPALCAWGFTTDTYQVPDDDTLAALRENIDYTAVTLDGETASIPEGVMVDLGAVAKGYTALVLTRMLADAGVESALLDLGGNIQAIGENPEGRPWGAAVQDPFGEGYLGVLSVTDRAVVTSGGYERNFEQNGVIYHHILDPDTAAPADTGLCAVTVVGENGLTCDALSTALYVMGKDAALDFWRSREDFECILVEPNGAVTVTEGLQDCFRAHVDAVTIAERG